MSFLTTAYVSPYPITGRLHRLYDQKREVRVYDYRDESIPMAERMFQRRFKKLLAIGYELSLIHI